MKRTITSVLSIALALIMVLSLAACGGGSNSSSENTTENTTKATLDKNDTSNYIGEWETDSFTLTLLHIARA